MKRSNFTKLLKLIKRYQGLLWAVGIISIGSLIASLWIYYNLEELGQQEFWPQLAGFLMNVSQAVLGTVLIGGILGGVINFIFEEQRQQEEAIKERLQSMEESKARRRQFRRDMRDTKSLRRCSPGPPADPIPPLGPYLR